MWREVAIAPTGYAQPPPIAERRCVLYERNSSIAGGHNKTMKGKGAQVTIVSAQQLQLNCALHTLLNYWRRCVSTVTLARRHRQSKNKLVHQPA
jgi:hypothetical protein